MSGKVLRHTLSQNMRAYKDSAYSSFLLSVGDGTCPVQPAVGPHSICFPEQIVFTSGSSTDELAAWVWRDVRDDGLRCISRGATEQDIAALSSKAILAPKNDVVNRINDIIIDTFDTQRVSTSS